MPATDASPAPAGPDAAPVTGPDAGRSRPWVPWAGLGVALLVVAASLWLPDLLGIDTMTRRDDKEQVPPLHGFWEPGVAPASVAVLLLAVVGVLAGERVAQRLPWRWLLVVATLVSLAWLLALALVDGESGLTRVLGNPYEYLETARDTDDVGLMLREFVDRIPYEAEDNWVTHVAGHPPGALLFFVVLARLGLGGDLAAALVVTVLAATIAAAVLVTLRALGAEQVARRAAPFLVLTPAAVFLAVSADAMFAAVAAWGLATLALGAVAGRDGRRGAMVAWSVLAGLLLGYCVLLSYGLPLLGIAALAVLLAARSWWPLPVAAGAALALVLAFAVAGFAWWEAFPVLQERYYDGVASERPQSYWVYGNLGALLISAGPLVGAGLAVSLAGFRRWLRDDATRGPVLLVAAGAAMLLAADLSGMSRSETERIWLPFMPWLTIGCALLPGAWRRWGLGLQVLNAVVVQHLMYTSW